MKKILLPLGVASLGLFALALSGCQHADARVVEDNTGLITTVDQIDIQDWERAAEVLVARLLNSGAIDATAGDPAILAVSRIVNNTSDRVDVDLLTRKIRVALSTTGLVRTTTVIGLGGAEDPLAQQQATSAPVAPDYSLSGKLIEVRAQAGRTRQSSFVFQLVLTEIPTGLAAWEGEETITKQGTRNAVGL